VDNLVLGAIKDDLDAEPAGRIERLAANRHPIFAPAFASAKWKIA
jgi:hypothetical protein